MSRHLPILAVQAAPVAWDVDRTWAKFESETRKLLGMFPQTRLLVYPELYLSALGPPASTAPSSWTQEAIAETVPGEMTDRICALARELDVWLVPGSFYERADDGAIYNTAVAVSPRGEIAAHYRKCFPWRPWESVAAGREFVVFDLDGVGRAGLMICYDGWFPEVARHLAWMGADVVFQPTATATADRDQELVLARANAIVNQIWVVNVNMGGRPGPGRSIIVDPEGHIVQLAGDGEEYQTEVLDLDAATRVQRYGSVGMNRLWKQIAEEGPGLELPLYGGSFASFAARFSEGEPAQVEVPSRT